MPNRVCEILNIDKPIVQGPMVWLTDAQLVGAVSKAGGLGSLGPNAGQTTLTRDPIETAERMRAEIHKVREITDRPFSVNILPAYGADEAVFTPPILKMVFEEKVPVATYVGDVVPEIFEELKNNDVKIIYRPLNPTVEAVTAAEKAGADIVVATGGFDEGGSLPNLTIGTFSVVPMIVDAGDVPVLAAGGRYRDKAWLSKCACTWSRRGLLWHSIPYEYGEPYGRQR